MNKNIITKICKKCEVEKSIDDFHRNIQQPPSYKHLYCKECRKKDRRIYYMKYGK